MSLRQRIVSGVGANAFNQLVTIGIQLVSLPVFLSYWSTAKYGVWLMLSAVPSYFSLADAGLTTVAANSMTMLMARHEHQRANEVFQTALASTAGIAIAVMLIATTIIWGVADLGSRDQSVALTCLIAATLLNILAGLFEATFRACGAYSAGTVALAVGRVVEWAGGVAGLFAYGTLAAVAAGALLARASVTAILLAYSRRRFPAFRWGVALATRRELKAMLLPGLSFLAFPIGLALSLQGMTILVGLLLGPARLAVFNTYRTLSRTLVQIAAVLSRSLWTEIARHYGAGQPVVVERLYRRGSQVATGVCGACAMLLILAGKYIIQAWTHGKIEYDFALLVAFVAAAFLNCCWQIGLVVISATNNHQRFSWAYLAASLASVIIAAALIGPMGMLGCVVAIGVAELAMLLTSRRTLAPILSGA